MHEQEQELRDRLVKLLNGKGAHATLEQALEKLPLKYYGSKVKNLPWTIWQLVEHIRMAQADILDYIKNPDYQEKAWPADYWPEELAPSSKKAFTSSLDQYRSDLQEVIDLINQPKTKILTPIPHLKRKHSLLREILLITDHTAYHTGQIILIRRLLGEWKD